MKKPSWLRWSRENKPADLPVQDSKAVRHRTDQKIRQQDAQKRQQDEDAKKPRRGKRGKKDSR